MTSLTRVSRSMTRVTRPNPTTIVFPAGIVGAGHGCLRPVSCWSRLSPPFRASGFGGSRLRRLWYPRRGSRSPGRSCSVSRVSSTRWPSRPTDSRSCMPDRSTDGLSSFCVTSTRSRLTHFRHRRCRPTLLVTRQQIRRFLCRQSAEADRHRRRNGSVARARLVWCRWCMEQGRDDSIHAALFRADLSNSGNRRRSDRSYATRTWRHRPSALALPTGWPPFPLRRWRRPARRRDLRGRSRWLSTTTHRRWRARRGASVFESHPLRSAGHALLAGCRSRCPDVDW